jgi:sterol desaturase/sphingolipid hydroxylase (fatty acid hydroxylase superfamily)
MDGNPILVVAAAFPIALFVGSLLEYGVHRFMHTGWLLGRKHALHHRDGWGQGFFGELLDYVVGSLPILWLGFLHSIPAGIGFAGGCITYAVLAAYAHQVQHERPELVFWMPRPVHHLHHKHHMWRHNFGILVDVWDRVFGTYQAAEWAPERRPGDRSLRRFFQIKWF